MAIELRPAANASVIAAVVEAARRSGVDVERGHPAYASPWRRHGLAAGVASFAHDPDTRRYAVPSRRRVRGAIRA